MAVVILNISESKGLTYGSGKQIYSLRINYTELCQFEHVFEYGLASCLRAAAVALELHEEKYGRGGWKKHTDGTLSTT
jgi:hypothetical protein